MGEAAADVKSALRQRVLSDETTDVNKPPSSSDDNGIPPAWWTLNHNGMPQAVAHRGYKASFPENTMGAFRGAVEVGAHAIETDLHLSKDKVVVISHDKDLKRCYGEEGLVRDRDWAYLQTLRTLREPRQPMPRLSELLAYLAEPGNEAVWLLLDIKIDDPAGEMIPRIAETILREAPQPPPSAAWTRRVVLGCWTAKHLRLCHELLPGFAIAWIGVTLPLARQYLRVPNVAINMRQEPLYCLGGPRFIRDCQEDGRPLYAWTVNKVSWMRWAIRKKLDCIMTDDPKLFLEVLEDDDDNDKEL
ncbi:PLC-like phosphodiesterase [Cryphonectria parasitica EP155]|uniref:PLC-like phosphodiesterase n=1 Tax=Cryphonectria parasitica (strain ATCC 38755 / EP155) TaxID=660469 RepID=A0A9P4XXV9_CRYP1|nr:PLC-like phosphodiesterase [Cryphonectria parasitica EP155]KAF3762881.1 PLC-like phosphodiesterase [Cryphonectria parasitica EP155]